MQKTKLVVILGPTASGKSDIAVRLAKKFNGEVISADSRQVYRGLDIGTGKITKKEMERVRHHLLDVASPSKRFAASEFKMLAGKAIEDILSRNKLPIVCGGTGFYIDALLGERQIPEVPPNLELRKKLEKKSAEALFKMLQKLDPQRAENIDAKNPRRLVRAIEICKVLGRVPKLQILNSKSDLSDGDAGISNKFQILKLGIKVPNEELKKRINKRLEKRIDQGMIVEARKLHAKGLSYRRMRELGLEYGALADFLSRRSQSASRPQTSGEQRIDKERMIERLQKEIWAYAKRQMTWFKKDKKIFWFTLSKVGGLPKIREINKLVAEFYGS